jgi:signal transduction histidine kinase
MGNVRIWRGLREQNVRHGFALSWVILAIVAVGALMAGSLAVGTLFAGTPPVPGAIVMGQMDVEAASQFRFGDVIRSIDGVRVSNHEAIKAAYARAGVGRVLDHEILRDGQVVHVASRVRPFDWSAYWLTSAPSVILAFGFFGLGLFLARVGRTHAEGRTLSVWCGVFGLALVLNANFSLVHAVFPAFALSCAMVGGLLMRLTAQMGPRKDQSWRPVYGSLLLAGVAMAIYPYGQAADYPAYWRQTGFFGLLAVIMLWPTVIGAVVFPWQTALNMRRVDRFSPAFQQNRVLFWSSVLAFLPPAAAWLSMLADLGTPNGVARLSLLTFLLLPAGMLFAVLRYRLFDIDVLIRRTIVYTTLAASLAGVYMALVGAFVSSFGSNRGEAFRLGLFMAMAMAFDPIRRRLQAGLDRAFDRGRANLMDVQRRINQRAAEHKDTSQTLESIAHDLQEALRLTKVAIALPQDEHLWVVAGTTELLGETLPLPAIPEAHYWQRGDNGDFPWPAGIEGGYAIRHRGRLNAVMLLGGRASEEALSRQDFDYLGLISGQLGLLLSYTMILDRQQLVDSEMQKLLKQVSELNELRSSFGIVAGHELRTPLTVIQGHAEALMTGVFGRLEPEQYESVQSIFRSANSLSGHIGAYLDLVSLRERKLILRPSSCDVGTLIFELLETWHPAIEERHLALRVDVDGVDKVHADPRRTRQVFDQLISNAIKFTPMHGSVIISARTEGALTQVQVIDNGPGIPPEALDRAFDEFAQVADPTQRDHGGLGLGLPLARALMVAMNGTLDYEPRVDGGSVFTCRLPAAQTTLQPRHSLNFQSPLEPLRVQAQYDPKTGLWRVRPEGVAAPAPKPGLSLDSVVYENAGTQTPEPLL